MIDAINTFGKPIGQYFETLTNWEIESGIFNFSGRDLGWFVIGFLVCLILWGLLDGKEIKFKKKGE